MTREIENRLSRLENEEEFNKFVVREYLKNGSVDEIFRANNYNLPISYPGVHRLLRKWEIVKAPGPNSSFSECVYFLMRFAEETAKKKIPLEEFYRSMPERFKTSLATLYRVYQEIRREVEKRAEKRKMRRFGTALVITQEDYKDEILVGRDVSVERLDVGKPFGSISLPMGFSKKSEPRRASIFRVLQQEVFTDHAVERRMPTWIIPQSPKPFMYIDITDVRVAVYRVNLPSEFSAPATFSSEKLVGHTYMTLEEITNGGRNFRAGVAEIGFGFNKHLASFSQVEGKNPILATSFLNKRLYALYRSYS